MSILTVQQTIIHIAGIEIDAYTAGEVSSITGAPTNYLSGSGLAESIGLEESTTRLTRLPKELKSLLGDSFTVRHGKYKMTSGGVTKANLWDTISAAKYYRYHDRKGNEKAGLIIDALASTTLDVIINDKFGVDYERGQAEQWVKARTAGKTTRRTFTDAVKEYCGLHPELSDNYRKFIYANCTDVLNRAVFGKPAKQLREEFQCSKDNLRDEHDAPKLQLIDRIEDFAMRLVDRGLEPVAAIKEAIAFYLS